MAFFGLSQPHDTRRPGFGPAPDAFAGLSRAGAAAEEDEGIDFEDTYDGLGDELDDKDDAFNDETFGSVERTNVGKDFDFYGQTAQVADTITEEQMVYGRKIQKPPPQPVQQPARRTVRLEDSQQIPDLKPEMSLWQTGPVQQEQPKQSPYNPVPVEPPQLPAPRKILSLEEVEAQLLAQQRQQQPQLQDHHAHMMQQHPQAAMGYNGLQNAMQQGPMQPQNLKQLMSFQAGINQQHQVPHYPQQHQQHQLQIPLHLQQQHQLQQKHHNLLQQQQQQLHQQHQFQQHQQVQHLPQQHGQNLPPQELASGRGTFPPVSAPHAPTQIQPTHIPTPQDLLLAQQMQDLRLPPTGPAAGVGVNPQFLTQLKPEQERLLQEESKRLKRNLKIAQLAAYNGIMTPNDKNYITRMQLQQLVSLNEDAFTEDFYYQVHSAIQARTNPQQPLNQFAQTYLFQQGQNNRGMRHRRQDNHLQRMEQQVQRAVAAAKARPKASQLVLEGSLGKISFSNVKTPRPMLSIKSTGDVPVRKNQKSQISGPDKKSILSSIEKVYDALLDLEMHERNLPPPLQPDEPLQAIHIDHQQKQEVLVNKLWDAMRILEPINPDPNVRHPFIAMLAYGKGKRAIPRIFRFVSNDQRTLMVTMIVAHLDVLDVVKGGLYHANETQLPAAVREEIELFCQTILPPLLQYVSEAPLNIVIGLLTLLIDRVDLGLCSQTKLGLQFLTMFLSRGEIIKEAAQADQDELNQWTLVYDKLFERLIPHLHSCFPPASNFVDDIYVWQFLASIAVGATMLQQQQLVEAVKERVMENYETSKTLPPELAAQKLANVNLFMRAIGLDVDLLG